MINQVHLHPICLKKCHRVRVAKITKYNKRLQRLSYWKREAKLLRLLIIYTDLQANGTMLFRTKKFKNWSTQHVSINRARIAILTQWSLLGSSHRVQTLKCRGTWASLEQARDQVSVKYQTSVSFKRWMCCPAYTIWETLASQIVSFNA